MVVKLLKLIKRFSVLLVCVCVSVWLLERYTETNEWTGRADSIADRKMLEAGDRRTDTRRG